MTDVDPLPHGLDAAMQGLHQADQRFEEARGGILRGGGGQPVWIALSEVLFWIDAVENYLWSQKTDREAYETARTAESGGRTALALAYVRNFHTHQLVSAGAARFEVASFRPVLTPPGEAPPPPGRGTLFTMELRWVPLADLPASARRDKAGRDRLYAEHVADRPLSRPVTEAIGWLRDRVALTNTT